MSKFELPKFNKDIKNPVALKAKGLCFALVGILSSAILISQLPHWSYIAMFLITIWAWCRFYYFLFYVLEHYAGRKRPYAGVLDALTAIFRREQ